MAIDRHHVGVTREHDPAVGVRTDAGDEVGLGAVRVADPPHLSPVGGQMLLGELDQLQIGAARGGVEGDQPLEDAGCGFGQGIGLCHGRPNSLGKPLQAAS